MTQFVSQHENLVLNLEPDVLIQSFSFLVPNARTSIRPFKLGSTLPSSFRRKCAMLSFYLSLIYSHELREKGKIYRTLCVHLQMEVTHTKQRICLLNMMWPRQISLQKLPVFAFSRLRNAATNLLQPVYRWNIPPWWMKIIQIYHLALFMRKPQPAVHGNSILKTRWHSQDECFAFYLSLLPPSWAMSKGLPLQVTSLSPGHLLTENMQEKKKREITNAIPNAIPSLKAWSFNRGKNPCVNWPPSYDIQQHLTTFK